MSEDIDDVRQTHPTTDGEVRQMYPVSQEGNPIPPLTSNEGYALSRTLDESTVQTGQSGSQSEISDSDTAETFPLAYVQKLRNEAAEARVKAKRAGELEAMLFTERVRATGRMADPSDLPFNAELLDDPDALTTAIDTLLGSKPHLASRTPRGNVGQGSTGASGDVDLAALLRAGA